MKRIEDIERLVVVVDAIDGFLNYGNLADPYINHIVPNIIQIIEEVIKENEGLAFVADCHDENSLENKIFPEHCWKGTGEELVVEVLRRFTKYGLFYTKNSTCALFAPGMLEDINKMKNLKRVDIVGCCTDICIINYAIPLICYFFQHNRDVQVNVYMDAVETYDAPGHNREEYNEMAFKLMKQAGINVIRRN